MILQLIAMVISFIACISTAIFAVKEKDETVSSIKMLEACVWMIIVLLLR